MGTKVPRGLTGQRLRRALVRLGFEIAHVAGSHHYLRHPVTGRAVVVSVHGGKRVVPVGTLTAILRQAGVSIDELVASL